MVSAHGSFHSDGKKTHLEILAEIQRFQLWNFDELIGVISACGSGAIKYSVTSSVNYQGPAWSFILSLLLYHSVTMPRNDGMKSDKIVRNHKPVHAFSCHATTADANMLKLRDPHTWSKRARTTLTLVWNLTAFMFCPSSSPLNSKHNT